MKFANTARSALILLVAAACSRDITDPDPGPADKSPFAIEALSPLSQSGTVGVAVSHAPTVRVVDADGQAVAGVEVRFEASGGMVTRAELTSRDGSAGIRWELGPKAGKQSMTATVKGVEPLSFESDALPGPVALVFRDGYEQSVLAGATIPHLTVRLFDRFQNPISGAEVTFSVVASSGTIADNVVTTKADGVARSGPWTLSAETGQQRAVAKLPPTPGMFDVYFTAYACSELIDGRCDGVSLASCAEPTDCGEIAFVSQRDGNAEIYSVNRDGSHVRRLTNNPGDDSSPSWSPDGRRIAFISNRFGQDELFVMNADGSGVSRVVNTNIWSPWGASSPAWSPDGSRIAVSHRSINGSIISVIDAATGKLVAETGYPRGINASPAWSSDGRIAFISDWYAFDFVNDVHVMDGFGSDARVLLKGPLGASGSPTPPGSHYFQPAWSPDARMLAIVVCPWSIDTCAWDASIGLVNSDGSGLRIIGRVNGFAHPAWSGDGTVIAYSTRDCPSCTPAIRYMSTDGSGIGGPIVNDGYDPAWKH